MAVSEDEFRRALSCFASGVSVVTTIDGSGQFHGLTVSAFCSVSLSPPLILVCIEKATASHFAFLESRAFVVNILREDQADLSEHFATPFDDKFLTVEHRLGIDGVPVLTDTLANLECRIKNHFDGGDHSIFVAEVEQIETETVNPLLYFRSGYHSIKSR